MDNANPTTNDWSRPGRIRVDQALELHLLAEKARPAAQYTEGAVVIIEPRSDQYEVARVVSDPGGATVQISILNLYRETFMYPTWVQRHTIRGAIEPVSIGGV